MAETKVRILRPELEEGRRILVVSDVHGNLPYLQSLLKQANFCPDDYLIVNGDFLEKGEHSLATLRFLMALEKLGRCFVVCGNCDGWGHLFIQDPAPERAEGIMGYVLWKKSGLVWDMINACGIDPFELESLNDALGAIRRSFRAEGEFLNRIPHAIETEKFIFAHAGMTPGKALEDHSVTELNRCDGLMFRDWSFDKWLVVGHWPVMLYGKDTVSANPIIDHERKIVSIDGGCVLKDDGQLNALVIPHKFSEDFEHIAYDPFPEMTVLDDQQEGKSSYYIRWGDSEVQVLERGEEFSLCRHVRTGYKMQILTKYLFTDNEYTGCNDCTDYILPLKKGDKVHLVETTSRGYFVKHKGVSGWYYGNLI